MLVHMEKFWEQKKVVNFFASLHIMDAHPDELPLPCFPFLLCLAFIWITLERIYGKLKKKSASYCTGNTWAADLFW